jgi:hypothetical protein
LECDVGKLLRELFKKILEIDNSDDGKVLMKQGCFEAFAYDNHRSVYSTCLVDNIELSIKKVSDLLYQIIFFRRLLVPLFGRN